jgi:hypothetical protein
VTVFHTIWRMLMKPNKPIKFHVTNEIKLYPFTICYIEFSVPIISPDSDLLSTSYIPLPLGTGPWLGGSVWAREKLDKTSGEGP